MKMFVENPFPGMNPWLEAQWSDVHSRLTLYACDQIESVLPSGLQARVEEYLSLEGPTDFDEKKSRAVPDITVYDSRATGEHISSKGIAVLEGAEPVVIQRTAEPMTLRYIEIVDLSSDRRVITAIEFISPANKTEKGAVQYRAKQQRLLTGGVSLVEVDLIRRGEWIVAADRSFYPRTLASPYRICVTRSISPDQSEVYRATYDQPLPSIRIPLRKTDEDICLPLQQLLNQAYSKGRYGSSLDYDLPPNPPLPAEDQLAVAKLLANSSLAD